MPNEAVVALVALIAVAGCATYEYVPGGHEADRVCGARAREASKPRMNEALSGLLIGPAFDGSQGQYERFMAVYEPCMTERGFPPGTPVRVKVQE